MANDEELEVEAVMVLRKKMKMRTVHDQIFVGKMDVYECPKPYVMIFNISTEHEHVVRMDVHKADLAREMRLWLEGKRIKSPLMVIPQRIEEVMTRFVKFGKAPLQEDLIMWAASRSELIWAPEPMCVFGGLPVPDPIDVAKEAAAAAEAAQKIKDEHDYGVLPNNFQKTVSSAKRSVGYQDDTVRMEMDNNGKRANNMEVREAFLGPDLGADPSSSIGEYNPMKDAAGNGNHGFTAGQMASLRKSRESHGPANTHMLTRQLLGKSQALSKLKAKKTQGRTDSTVSVVTPQLDEDHYRLGCEIQRARRDVNDAMDKRRKMIEIAKERQKHSAEHYRAIRAKSQEDAHGWSKGAQEELLTLQKIKLDIEEDVRKQKNMVHRAQQKVMWTLAPAGYANRKGKSQPGVLIGPGPLPPQALFEQKDPLIEKTLKQYYWDSHGRRHHRANGSEYDDGDTAEIIHHALESLRNAGKTLGLHKLDLKSVFHEFDTSGDGYLSIEEMASALISLDVKLNTEAILALFHHFDPNGSGSVHYGEFLWAFFNRRELARQWKRSISRLTPKEIVYKFNQADTTGNGRLNKREFTKFLKSFGITSHTPSEVDVMMYRFDVDGDGELDMKEFKQFMENEIQVLNNADTLKSDVSPILAQSRKVVYDDMHKNDAKKSKSKTKNAQHSSHHHCVINCAQYKLHGSCAHTDQSNTEAAPEGKDDDPEFITSALKAQANLERKVPLL
jgi:calcium-binding protein CML